VALGVSLFRLLGTEGRYTPDPFIRTSYAVALANSALPAPFDFAQDRLRQAQDSGSKVLPILFVKEDKVPL
jgi:hypothetical protein